MKIISDNEYRFASTACWRWVTILSTIVLPFSPLRASDAQQFPSDPESRELPLDASKFELLRGPIEDDTPGAMSVAGSYLWRDVVVVKRVYRTVGRKVGGATVETVDHSVAYPYVVHDLFGIFCVNHIGKTFDDEKVRQRFVNWVVGESNISHTISVTLAHEKNDAFSGNVAWYSSVGTKISTVVVYFGKLDGVPVQLIDEFLRAYPSSVKESDSDSATWEADDVQKWIHLLQLHKSDKVMFGMALGRLAVYDHTLFGVDRKQLATDDTAMLDKAIEEVKRGAEQWLTRRATKKQLQENE